MSNLLKDEVLANLAKDYNVARFFSSDPNLRIRQTILGEQYQDVGSMEDAINFLLSQVSSVNVRTFLPDKFSGNPFVYELKTFDEVWIAVQGFASQGYYCIVNETIAIDDGGVSGVVDSGIVEFAPDDTPRAVEKAGICSLPIDLANQVLGTVYGVLDIIPNLSGKRVEFSIHPHPVGNRLERLLVWESSDTEITDAQIASSTWPNRFSRHIGDKAYGLLIADALGFLVPKGTLVGRRVAPFSFGTSTGTNETWIRTCPIVQQPGKFTTTLKWVDPFVLMQTEDSNNSEIQSLLFQESVKFLYSGATLTRDDGILVEGVTGSGDSFMGGSQEVSLLPEQVVEDVRNLVIKIQETMHTTVRIEWVHDGFKAWVVQLHNMGSVMAGSIPESVINWVVFNPKDGLDVLRNLIGGLDPVSSGVQITEPIGITSHVGDLLRKNKISFRFGE